MKYMVPEINISKFSLENIVTDSAVAQAQAKLEVAGVASEHTVVANFTGIDDWIAQ